jgi:hypothetical protein
MTKTDDKEFNDIVRRNRKQGWTVMMSTDRYIEFARQHRDGYIETKIVHFKGSK